MKTLGAISFDAVKMLLLARLENRPARLDLTFYPRNVREQEIAEVASERKLEVDGVGYE